MLIIAATVFAIVLLARAAGILEPLEIFVYDRFLSVLASGEPPDLRIVLVAYTEQDIQDQGVFPLPDATLAETIRIVLEAGPRAIGVDLYRDVAIPPGTKQLEEVLTGNSQVIMISRYGEEGLLHVGPPPVLEGTDQVGFSDLKLDRDDTVRRGILYQEDETLGIGLSLALRTALLYLAHEQVGLALDPDDPELLRLGPTTITRFHGNDGGYSDADDGGYQILLDYHGGGERFATLSIGDVLRGDFEPELFRERIVFIGVTAETHVDVIQVPFGLWPGFYLHAHIASQLLRYGLGESLPQTSLTEFEEAGWILLFILLGAALGLPRISTPPFVLLALGGAAGLIAISMFALDSGWWLPVAAPGVGWLASAFGVMAWLSRREHFERVELMQIFSRHLSHDVAEALWEQRDEFLDGGRPRPQRLVCTILFADVKDSTRVGEKLDPLAFMEWLNGFLDTMAKEAGSHGGIVDDYFGDGLKADFGIPVARTREEQMNEDAVGAVRCAVAMEAGLQRLNARWRAEGLPLGAMRVGIGTGEVVAGSIGAADRLKYSVVGDTVNVAARLESLDDSAHDFGRKPCRILVSEETRKRLGGRFETRELGEFSLKGKEVRIRVSEVLGPNLSGGQTEDSK